MKQTRLKEKKKKRERRNCSRNVICHHISYTLGVMLFYYDSSLRSPQPTFQMNHRDCDLLCPINVSCLIPYLNISVQLSVGKTFLRQHNQES